jgi:hypothetical protein
MRINEMRHDGISTGLFSDEEDEYTDLSKNENEFIGQDMIGDGEDDFIYGTMDEPSDFDIEIGDEVDEDMIEPIQEQVNKTLDMFKRFKNF